MKIAYIHGLESKIRQEDPKIQFLNQNFSEVYTPQIDYRESKVFNNIYNHIQQMKPDLIIGSSMGGYFSYVIGSKLQIPTILFNPAVIDRPIEPKVDSSDLKGTQNHVFLGEFDNVIRGSKVRQYFQDRGVGEFKYEQYDGEHRVPALVFIDSIQKVMNIYKK
jgi:predicted esterase YcpF (UPF0227 family)